jgi:hypothetical protein
MVTRLRPSHRIRQVSGPTRPAPSALASFWSSFNPEECPKEIWLRYRSAPWDIIDDVSLSEDGSFTEDATPSETDSTPEILDSPKINILGTRPKPTHYVSVGVPTPCPQQQLSDPVAIAYLRTGVHLPPPHSAPRIFQSTRPSELLEQLGSRSTTLPDTSAG